MSACAIKHWGTGTPCVKESNTAASKEMAAKLSQMQAERDRQDTMWNDNVSEVDKKSQESQKAANQSPLRVVKKR